MRWSIFKRSGYRFASRKYDKEESKAASDSADSGSTLGHMAKKLLGFFDSGMLQLFEFERFLFDHVISRGGQAL
jgi:hypothetical protein